MFDSSSDNISKLLLEAGGHRWQRVPPSERNGRVHTSTVTVAAFELKDEDVLLIPDSDLKIFTTKDSGPGGQHRNKTESCVVIRHLPTGIEAKASSKSQHHNRRVAMTILQARVMEYYHSLERVKVDNERRNQVGSGMRGDKIRTYRQRDNLVIDHRANKKTRLDRFMEGVLP